MLFSNDFKTNKVEVNGVTINYKIGGRGEPLLLIHGYPQTHTMWYKVANELSKEFTNKWNECNRLIL